MITCKLVIYVIDKFMDSRKSLLDHLADRYGKWAPPKVWTNATSSHTTSFIAILRGLLVENFPSL